MRYIALELHIPYDNDDFDLWKSNFYDTENKCIVVDNYGHGSSPTITEYIDYKKAIAENIITVDELVEAICKYLNVGSYGVYDFNINYIPAFIPCSITGGRKMKGDNKYFLYNYTQGNSYMRRMRCSTYFDTELVVIYDPVTNEICEVNPKFVELKYDSIERIKKSIRKDEYRNLLTLVHAIAYKQSYYSCDAKNYKNTLIRLIHLGSNVSFNINNAKNPWKDKQLQKKQEKLDKIKESKRIEIEKWANILSDKTDEERKQIVEKTLTKYLKNYEHV